MLIFWHDLEYSLATPSQQPSSFRLMFQWVPFNAMCCLNRVFKISSNQLVRQFNFKITNSFHFKCFDLYQFLLRKDTYYKLCSHGINKHIKVVRYNLCKIGKIDHCKYITLCRIIFTRRSLFRRAWMEEIKNMSEINAFNVNQKSYKTRLLFYYKECPSNLN